MKKWYITHEDKDYDCSLMSLAGRTKLATLIGPCGILIKFQFMKFHDFSRARDGIKQTGWVKLPHTQNKVRASIIFKR